MKYTIPFICAALTSTSAFAQERASEPADEGSASHPVSEVFFAFDSWALPASMPDLAPLLKWAEEHPSGSIVLDGNADSIGAATYNVRLSARRAESVRDRLIQLGVDEDRIVVAIYGEDGLRRTENALDRRVTIWTTHDPIYAIVDSTLVRGKAVLWSRPVTYAELHPTLPEEVATR